MFCHIRAGDSFYVKPDFYANMLRILANAEKLSIIRPIFQQTPLVPCMCLDCHARQITDHVYKC